VDQHATERACSQEAVYRGSFPAPQERKFWGAIRHCVMVWNYSGDTDIACEFAPDDGTKPTSFLWERVPDGDFRLTLADGARCTYDGTRLLVKAFAEDVKQAEEHFAHINSMPLVERAFRHARDNGLAADAGWVWEDSDHTLHKIIDH
jgi:hypothetical protein